MPMASAIAIDDDEPTLISYECERGIVRGQIRAEMDPRIDPYCGVDLGAPWNRVLEHGRCLAGRVSGWSRPYKIGITRDLLHRFRDAKWNYVKDGFVEMHCLLCATPAQCVRLEIQLIKDARSGIGPPQCLNIRAGGDSPPKTEHCFAYVVVR